jgi:hypothetical protein
MELVRRKRVGMNRYFLAGLCLGISEIVVIVAVCLSFHNRGYKRGHQAGFEKGFEVGSLREQNWWLDTEKDADQARQQIWREEPISGDQIRGDEIQW